MAIEKPFSSINSILHISELSNGNDRWVKMYDFIWMVAAQASLQTI